MATVTGKQPMGPKRVSTGAKARVPVKSTSRVGRTAKTSSEFTTGRDFVVLKQTNTVMVAYKRSQGVDAYLEKVHEATPTQLVEMERVGVAGTFIADLSKRMKLPSSRMYSMLRISPATVARKSTSGGVVDGRAGLAAMGMIKLLKVAQNIVADSTASEAKDFDTFTWLGQWIEKPQPALGGKKPADYLDTPTGVEIVTKVLGAIRSGAYL